MILWSRLGLIYACLWLKFSFESVMYNESKLYQCYSIICFYFCARQPMNNTTNHLPSPKQISILAIKCGAMALDRVCHPMWRIYYRKTWYTTTTIVISLNLVGCNLDEMGQGEMECIYFLYFQCRDMAITQLLGHYNILMDIARKLLWTQDDFWISLNYEFQRISYQGTVGGLQ